MWGPEIHRVLKSQVIRMDIICICFALSNSFQGNCFSFYWKSTPYRRLVPLSTFFTWHWMLIKKWNNRNPIWNFLHILFTAIVYCVGRFGDCFWRTWSKSDFLPRIGQVYTEHFINSFMCLGQMYWSKKRYNQKFFL